MAITLLFCFGAFRCLGSLGSLGFLLGLATSSRRGVPSGVSSGSSLGASCDDGCALSEPLNLYVMNDKLCRRNKPQHSSTTFDENDSE